MLENLKKTENGSVANNANRAVLLHVFIVAGCDNLKGYTELVRYSVECILILGGETQRQAFDTMYDKSARWLQRHSVSSGKSRQSIHDRR
jgi:hypothetical protein